MHTPYRILIIPDTYTDGTPCYVAQHPELPGCMAQGDTPEEALASLHDARADYLYFLKEDGLPAPLPAAVQTIDPASSIVLQHDVS